VSTAAIARILWLADAPGVTGGHAETLELVERLITRFARAFAE